MTKSSNEKQSNLNVGTELGEEAANTTGTSMGNAGSEQGAIASRNVLADLPDSPEPTFLDGEGPNLDVPLFITKANARELFGLRRGETVAQALAREPKDG